MFRRGMSAGVRQRAAVSAERQDVGPPAIAGRTEAPRGAPQLMRGVVTVSVGGRVGPDCAETDCACACI